VGSGLKPSVKTFLCIQPKIPSLRRKTQKTEVKLKRVRSDIFSDQDKKHELTENVKLGMSVAHDGTVLLFPAKPVYAYRVSLQY